MTELIKNEVFEICKPKVCGSQKLTSAQYKKQQRAILQQVNEVLPLLENLNKETFSEFLPNILTTLPLTKNTKNLEASKLLMDKLFNLNDVLTSTEETLVKALLEQPLIDYLYKNFSKIKITKLLNLYKIPYKTKITLKVPDMIMLEILKCLDPHYLYNTLACVNSWFNTLVQDKILTKSLFTFYTSQIKNKPKHTLPLYSLQDLMREGTFVCYFCKRRRYQSISKNNICSHSKCLDHTEPYFVDSHFTVCSAWWPCCKQRDMYYGKEFDEEFGHHGMHGNYDVIPYPKSEGCQRASCRPTKYPASYYQYQYHVKMSMNKLRNPSEKYIPTEEMRKIRINWSQEFDS
jgi:hypothetical protein